MSASKVVLAAFSEEQTENLTGITRSQLRYWDRTRFYSPTYSEKNRRVAFSRVYSFKDIVSLRVLNVLRNQYSVSLQHLRDVSSKLRKLNNNPDCWVDTKLYPLNKKVIWIEPDTKLPQEIASGQYITVVSLSDVVQETKKAAINVHKSRDESKLGAIERSKYVQHNSAVVAGTRITVAAIKRFAEAGYSAEQILKEYPDITKKDVQAALDYKDSSAAA